MFDMVAAEVLTEEAFYDLVDAWPDDSSDQSLSTAGLVAVEMAAGTSLDELDDDTLVAEYVGLRRLIGRLEAQASRRLAEIDARCAYTGNGYASTTAFVKHRCRTTGGRARRAVADARELAAMPVTRNLTEAGELSPDQTRVLIAAYEHNREQFTADEATLCDVARNLEWVGDLRTAVDYWAQACAEPRWGDEQREARYLHISRTFEGMVKLDGLFDREAGETLIDALDAATTPPTENENRSAAQRRADALVDLVSTGGTRRRNRPELLVHVDLQTLTAGDLPRGGLSETQAGVVLGAATVRRIACDASVRRIVFGADAQPLDVGRALRVPNAALRIAVAARDRHCRFPGCDRPHWWCDEHHIEHWADGGPTNLDNLLLLCRYHHTAVHERGYTIRGPAADAVFHRPDGRLLGGSDTS